jgi:hypothetical protein
VLSELRWLCACLAALSLAACGDASDSSHTARSRHAARPTVCKPQSRATIARVLAVPSSSVAARAGTGNNGMPQCSFSVTVPGPRRIRVTANIDNAPQAAFRLMRTVVEATQVWSTAKLAPPQNISGLGIGADWFPAEQQLLTSDGVRLITVTISWRHASTRTKTALAESVARTYLGPLRPPS